MSNLSPEYLAQQQKQLEAAGNYNPSDNMNIPNGEGQLDAPNGPDPRQIANHMAKMMNHASQGHEGDMDSCPDCGAPPEASPSAAAQVQKGATSSGLGYMQNPLSPAPDTNMGQATGSIRKALK